MKAAAGIFTLLLGLALAGRAEVETSALAEDEVPARNVHRRLGALLKQEVGTFVAPAAPAETDGAEASQPAGDLLVLEPFKVEGKKLPPPPQREAPAQKFFRTGTIWESVGPRFTKRFWMKGDRGIMFSFSW